MVIKLKEASQPVLSVKYSPDGAFLATGSADDNVRVYDVPNYDLVATLRKTIPNAPVGLAWSSDGQYLAAGAGRWEKGGRKDGTVAVWNVSDWSLAQTLNFRPESGVAPSRTRLHSLVWSPDGQFLVAGGGRQVFFFSRPDFSQPVIDVFDVSDMDPERWSKVRRFGMRRRYNSSWFPRVNYLTFSGDGGFLAGHYSSGGSALQDRLRIFDSSSPEPGGWAELIALPDPSPPRQSAFSTDGSMFASADWNGEVVYVYETERWTLLQDFNPTVDSMGPVTWSPGDQFLAVGAREDPFPVLAWDIPTGSLAEEVESNHFRAITDIAWHPFGIHVAAASEDNDVAILDTPFATGPTISVDVLWGLGLLGLGVVGVVTVASVLDEEEVVRA